MKRFSVSVLAAVVCLLSPPARAGDWPQFRCDAGRTAASPHALPAALQLRWTRTLPAPRPAFPGEIRLAFDASYEPVVLGDTMFVPSMVTDCVTALDVETGAERWRFIAEGPVRFAPVAWEGKVYFVSDDGYLYCLDAADGSLLWRFRGLPEGSEERWIMGNGRLISLHPARGGPVLADGIVYFAAGLWPTEGVFVHAIDAESGEPVWSNTDSHHIPKSNWDHGIGFKAGLTPQGYLAVVGEQLVVPCGTQLPAFLDRRDGTLGTYTMGWGGRVGLPKGCWFVAGVGNYLSHGGDLYDITRPNNERFADTPADRDDYKPMLYPGGWTRLDIEPGNQKALDSFRRPVLTPEAMYESGRGIAARDLTSVTLQERRPADIPLHRRLDRYPDNYGAVLRRLWRLPSKLDVHIKAGNRLYVGGPGVVEAIDTDAEDGPKIAWRAEIEGTPQRMLAAAGKLFVVTSEGAILAFAAPQAGDVVRHTPKTAPSPTADWWTERATAMLEATGVRDGFALVLGIERGRLVEELVWQSDLYVIAVDADAEKAAALRHRLHDAGLYGKRAAVLTGDPVDYPFPPYLASLVVTEDPDRLQHAGDRALAEAVFRVLRPYGGVACAWGSLADRSRMEEIVQDDAFPNAAVKQAGGFVLLTRSGALPGAADWSHAAASAANAGASADDRVRSALNVLWFDAPRRWHRQPGHLQVRVAGGRLVILESGLLRATDAYTGRTLWETELPVGLEPLTDLAVRQAIHRQPGRAQSLASGTELVVLADNVYVNNGTSCLVLDPATGEITGQIDLPDGLEDPWANLRVNGDYLIGSSGPHVLCVHRVTGELLWQAEMDRAGLSLAVGGGKVFCAALANRRRGEDETRDGSTRAMDLRTGELLWERPGGAVLRYSEPLDLVVTPVGFYRGADGAPVAQPSGDEPARWIVEGRGLAEGGLPGVVAGQRLLTGSEQFLQMYELPSGEAAGEPLEWVRRGCTGTRASTHLLTTRYRSNSAWIDLATREITPFLGVRPGCTVNNNLYPADGVLNMPNLTGGCTCNFASVSLSLVPAEALRR